MFHMIMKEEIKTKMRKIKELQEQIESLKEEVKPSTRSIQITTGGTFFICLPKDWCIKHNITKGSDVLISQQEDCLIIVP